MKPGVFTQLYVHLIFAPKYRERLLRKRNRASISPNRRSGPVKSLPKARILSSTEPPAYRDSSSAARQGSSE